MRTALRVSFILLTAISVGGMSARAAAHWPVATDYIYATVLSCQDTVSARRDIVEQLPAGYAALPRVQKLLTDPLTMMTVHVHRHPGLLEWYSGDKVYRFWTPGNKASDVMQVQMTISPKECTKRLLNQTRYFGVARGTCDVSPPGLICLLHVPVALEIPVKLPPFNCRLADVRAGHPCESAGNDGPPVRGDGWPQQARLYRYRLKVTACADTTKQRQAYVKHHPRAWPAADLPDTSLATTVIEEADDFVNWTLQGNHYYFMGARRQVHITGDKFALMDQSAADCRKDLLGHRALCVADNVDCSEPEWSKAGCAVNAPLTHCMAAPSPPAFQRFPCDLAQVLATGECRAPT